MRIPSFILAAALALSPALAPQPAVAQDARAALVARLDSIAAAPVIAKRAVGIVAAVVRGTDTLLLRGYGKSDALKNIAMPADAFMEMGSVTKQFTAAAILQLRDAGKVDLDADLHRYLPQFDTHGNVVTVRQLLNHTSGIRGITEIAAFPTLFNTGYPRDSALALIERQPFDFPPGEAMIYNNSGFVILGHIIEKASGMSYEDYVERKIFAPLGMTHSRYCNNAEVVPLRARGHVMNLQGTRPADPNDHTWPFAAGSLCSTAGDMVTWLKALHHGKVLGERSYRDMTTPSHLGDGTTIRYGMGIGVSTDVHGRRMIGHGGAITGFTADTRWYPDADLYIVVLNNSNGPTSPSAVAGALADAIIQPTPVPPLPFTGDVTPLLGKYTGPSRGRPMTVEVTAGPQGIAISTNAAPALPAGWVKEWTFRLGETYLTFDRKGADGRPALLRFDAGSGYYKLKRE